MRMPTAIRFFFYILISINLHVYTAGLNPAVPDTLTPPRLAAHTSFASRVSSESDSPSITESDLNQNYARQLSSIQYTPDHSPRIEDSAPGTTPPSPGDAEVTHMQAKIKDERLRYGSRSVADRSEQLHLLRIAETEEPSPKASPKKTEKKRSSLDESASYAAKSAALTQYIDTHGHDPVATAILRSDSKTARKWSEDFESAPAFSPASSSSTSPASSATSSAYSSATPSAATSPKQSPSLGPVLALGPLSGSPSDRVYRAPASPSKPSLWQMHIKKKEATEKERDKDKPKRATLISAALTSLSLSSPKNASPSSTRH